MSGMGYIGRRILLIVPTILGVFTLVFLILHLAPGDPIQVMLMDFDANAPAGLVEDLRAQFGLDKPLYVQYFVFIKNAITGNLGKSIIWQRSVVSVLLPTIRPTIMLASCAILMSILIGIPTGVAAALHRNRPTDYASMAVAVAWLAMPGFWLGILLIYFFGFKLPIFPMFGGGSGGGIMAELHHLVLPAFAIGARSAALLARMTRSSILEVLGQDYIRTARSKGLTERVVVYKHALRNAVIPVITVVGMDLAYLLGGTVIVETVFGRVGLGKTMVDAIIDRDYPVAQGAILMFAVGIIVVNLLTDLAYAVASPKIRLGK
jgi:ABC-type dipeptide/oligopeptide/nickel transport system permease component